MGFFVFEYSSILCLPHLRVVSVKLHYIVLLIQASHLNTAKISTINNISQSAWFQSPVHAANSKLGKAALRFL